MISEFCFSHPAHQGRRGSISRGRGPRPNARATSGLPICGIHFRSGGPSTPSTSSRTPAVPDHWLEKCLSDPD